jgi:hypothetical protein
VRGSSTSTRVGAEARHLGERSAQGAVDVAGQRRRKELLRQADAQALQRPAPRGARRALGELAWKSCGGRSALVESRASNPLIAPRTIAQSSALRASTPAWSRLDANAIIP